MDEIFTETTNTIAASVPCNPATVRSYSDWGLIEHRRLANGVRLFKRSAIERVRKLRAERLAHRGGRRRAEAPAT
jgi:hypothetical protein